MPTRAAVLREAFLAAKSLSSPPPTPTDLETTASENILVSQALVNKGSVAAVIGADRSGKLPAPLISVKRKRASAKNKKTQESIKIELEVLPHGLGRKGELLDDAGVENLPSSKTPILPELKKRGHGKAALEIENISRNSNDVSLKIYKREESIHLSKSGQPGSIKRDDPLTVNLLPESLPKKRKRSETSIKSKEDVSDAADEDFEERPRKKGAISGKKTLAGSENILDKVDVTANSRQSSKRPKKTNKYGLMPGKTPFPYHAKPTPEDCEEVNRLLSALHGEVKPPDVIPPPSMEVTGCGEVPDLLDAILRTLLSASTTADNANLSLQGLKEKFHLRESGVGKGSINWEAVHKADLSEVIDAIKSGGLATVKGTNIKKILDVVHEQNCARREAFLNEKETGKPADIPRAKNMTEEQKKLEIAKASESMLSLDHLFEMTTDEAMEEMTKLPGIGVKTASCVILFCMKRPSFAVDTHVWRHCKWLGWVPEKATRDQTFSHCEVRVPDHVKYSLHQLFLKHGKTCGRCRANTSAGTEDWDNTDCPIDHLVSRTGKKKMSGIDSIVKFQPRNKKKEGKNGKT
jgi:endonuclease III